MLAVLFALKMNRKPTFKVTLELLQSPIEPKNHCPREGCVVLCL